MNKSDADLIQISLTYIYAFYFLIKEYEPTFLEDIFRGMGGKSFRESARDGSGLKNESEK